jgi:actin-related protein 9
VFEVRPSNFADQQAPRLTFIIIDLAPAIQARLSTAIATDRESEYQVQPKHIRILKVPDYFANHREKGEGTAAFLGACIVAKVCIRFQS